MNYTATGYPIKLYDVTDSGFATRTVPVNGFGQVLRSAFRIDAELQTDMVPLSNARAAFDFTQGDSQGWKTGAKSVWTITMEPGDVLVDCR